MSTRRRMLMQAGSTPPSYQRVEYLESGGTQYVNLGNSYPRTTTSTTIWRGEIGYSAGSSGRRWIASYGASWLNNYSEITIGNTYGNGYSNKTVPIDGNALCEVQFMLAPTYTEFQSVVNGVTYTSTWNTPASADTTDFLLFRLNNNYKGVGQRIGHNVFIYDGVIRLDLYPVRIGTTGYMYDTISQQLYGNAGTGNFILGPDI